MMLHMETVSVVIPVFKSEETLPELYGRLVKSLESDKRAFEIIFVEDCGGDKSWDVISKLHAADERVRAIRLNKNCGQHNAILCGIREAKGEVIVTLDDDLQHPPEKIPELLSLITEDIDLVYGAPRKRVHGFGRSMLSVATKFVLSASMGAGNARNVGPFRVFKTELREGFSDFKSPAANIDVLLSWSTNKVEAHEIDYSERRAGYSNYSFFSLGNHALNMVTGFSTRPLHFATILGFVSAVFGLSILTYIIFKWLLLGSVVPGFFFLACMIAIFSGSQLLVLGIVGEYLGRVHSRVVEKPTYVVSERLG